jgi:hypothetical protein
MRAYFGEGVKALIATMNLRAVLNTLSNGCYRGDDQQERSGYGYRMMSSRQPHARAARDRDHRRRLPFANAFISAVTVHPPIR